MTASSTPVRDHCVDALYADLVGPFAGASAHDSSTELTRRPTEWYLTGFLVPERDREPPPDELEGQAEGDEVPTDDADNEPVATKVPKLFPASMGLSVLLPPNATTVVAHVSFAQYEPERVKREGVRGPGKKLWRRVPQPTQTIPIRLDEAAVRQGFPLPNNPKVVITGRLGTLTSVPPGLEAGTRALSLFVVNRQPVQDDELGRDGRTLFQVQLAVECTEGFCPRPNRAALAARDDGDAQVLDLQYRERVEYAVGHNVAAEPCPPPHQSTPPHQSPTTVTRVRTRWIPRTDVRLVRAHEEPSVEVQMEALASLESPADVANALDALPAKYAAWLNTISAHHLTAAHDQVRADLLLDARAACNRIRAGIALLKEHDELRHAFCLTNRAMAQAARQRSSHRYTSDVPKWRLFQLAFLLLNITAIHDPHHDDRKRVELIFFPTGGGKTEAYLGLIAFALLLRRMRGRSRPDGGLGVGVLLRYTLRLLTLDQLARATTLVCALELLRENNPTLLGDRRFSMGLWVGQSATPNRFVDFQNELDLHNQQRRSLPCPLERCPWCNHPLAAASLALRPNKKKAERIEVRCLNAGHCPFANPHPEGLPLVFVDEHVYRELPSFIIATVDKFAMMPWRGETALLFGKATHHHDGLFYGALDKPPRAAKPLHDGLLPPDVIVQDELHLITGPLGTMVGLYEVALQLLATSGTAPNTFRPKLVASTATAHHARDQIRALYGDDRLTSIFPPPGIDALETFFSTVDHEAPGRLYVGVAAPGHPIKRVLLRVYVSLLTAAKKLAHDASLPAAQRDAAMTLVGYFNSLRELGGMRRLVEDDVRTQSKERTRRLPEDTIGGNPWFADRDIAEPLELTSRRTTGEISEAKGRLERPHADTKTTDVVLASNMISVGVDIDRLGLMVVGGQPKTTSEYIQASSRVGRDRAAPGLVVTCFHVARPRDRSHYEHFVAYHESFYRFVEAQSVTPFALRALDRGLTGAFMAAVRLSDHHLTPPSGAMDVASHLPHIDAVREAFVARSGSARATVDEWLRHRVDKWQELVTIAAERAPSLTYSPFDVGKAGRTLLHTTLEPPAEPLIDAEDKFCAPTSMRDVEPSVHPNNQERARGHPP